MPPSKITLVSLDKEPWFDDMFSNNLSALRAKSDVAEITTPTEASELFATRGADRPDAVLATDSALATHLRNVTRCSGCIATNKPLRKCTKCHSVAYCDRKCQKEHWGRHKDACATLKDEKTPTLAEQAAGYVQAGGKLIFMGTFSSTARVCDVGPLFAHFDLPWDAGDYHRADFTVNPNVESVDTSGLVASYSQKALHLKNVPSNTAVYLSSGVSYSPVFGVNAVNRAQSPAVFGTCGSGRLGYIGDVNYEAPTTPLLLAMCGL